MSAEGAVPNSNVSKAVNVGLYPDLVELGGLVSAMTRTAHEQGLELGTIRPASESERGRYTTAEADSERGQTLLLLGSQKRWFSISIESATHPWASGGTDDLLSAVKVVNAWHSGATLEELSTRFPFMEFSELAQAYESGDPVATQWKLLQESEESSSSMPLIHRVHLNDRLQQLFPFLSHGTLRLAEDPYDRRAGEISITPLTDGRYRVESTDVSKAHKEAESLSQAVDHAVSLLDRPSPSNQFE